MKTLLVRISPDGKEVIHLYSDQFSMKDYARINITRATDVYFDNNLQKWRVKLLSTGEILPNLFYSRDSALAYEQWYLEDMMRSREV